MIEMKELTEEQKKEVDELFAMVLKTDPPFQVLEKEGYLAIYSTNPHVMKAVILEAFVSLLNRKEG